MTITTILDKEDEPPSLSTITRINREERKNHTFIGTQANRNITTNKNNDNNNNDDNNN